MYVFRILNIELELDPTLIRLALLDSSDKLIQSCAFCTPLNYTNSEPPLLSPLHLYSELFRYTTPFWHVLETWFVTSVWNTLDATEGRHSTRAEANCRKPLSFQTSGLDFRRIRVAWATCNRQYQNFLSHLQKPHPSLDQSELDCIHVQQCQW